MQLRLMEPTQPYNPLANERNDDITYTQHRRQRLAYRNLAAAFAVTVVAMVLLFVLLWTLLPRSAALPAIPSKTTSDMAPRTAALPVVPKAAAPTVVSSTTPLTMCSSEACISASALLLRSLDRSADPCEDFYSFACGGVDRNYPFAASTLKLPLGMLPDEGSKLDARLFELFFRPKLGRSPDPELSRLHQAARDMFLSCVAWHDPETWWLPPQLKTSPHKAERPRDLAVLQQALIREIDKPTELEGFLAMLVRTQTSGLLRLADAEAIIDQVETGPRRPYLSLVTMRFEISLWSNAAIIELPELCKLLGIELTAPIHQVIEIQSKLSKIFQGSTSAYSLKELQAETDRIFSSSSSFYWIHFINILNVDDSFVDGNSLIKILHFSKLMQVLKQLAPEFASRKGALFDFLRVDAAMSLRNFLPKEKFPALIASYTRNKFLVDVDEGSTKNEGVVQFCMDMPMKSMTPIVYDMFKRAYVRDNFSLVHSLVSDIEDAMKLNANEEPWIHETSKRAITDKLNSVKSIVGQFELSASELKSIFNPAVNLKSQSTWNFGDTVLIHNNAKLRMLFSLQTSGRELHNSFNTFFPLAINTFYVTSLNSINILTGMLGTFLFNNGIPDYLLFGGIGSVISHELAHAFSYAYDENINMHPNTIYDGMTNETLERKLACLIKSYDGLFMEQTTVTRLFGKRTIAEDFADIVGLNAAFRAYTNHQARSGKALQLLPGPLGSALTPDQLFFVQAAQWNCVRVEKHALLKIFNSRYCPYSPPKSRVLGSMMHSKAFSRVFRCKPENKMHLSDAAKCHIW